MADAVERLSAALADRYVIDRELGAGGMATVYLAHDVRHDRKVALKVLRPELSAILGADRFLHEIKTTANLQHPHILGLFDSGEADGLVFYVMPYVEGESLRDRIGREKQLPVEDAVRIACEVADALDYAHRHGVIHRDIKPENILLHDGHAQVADFGIALAVSSAGAGTRMTETGMSLGTPHYMSPEQAMGQREINAKSDVYALGCVLYEMLTGEPPFNGPTAQAIIARVMTEEPRSLVLQRKTVPPHVEAAVHAALEKLPGDRLATAAQFAEALRKPGTLAQAGAPGHHGTGARAKGTALPPYRLTVLLPWLLAAGALGLAGWALQRPGPASSTAVTRLPISLPDSAPLRPQFGILFALSDDGSQIVYVGPGQGDVDLWSRPLNSLVATRIPGTNGADSPFLSPAGDVVAFYRNTPNAVFTVSLRGGPRQTLATDSIVPFGGDFGPDGAIYFTRRGGIRRLKQDSRVVEAVTTVDSAAGELSHGWVDVLPGGRGALFTIGRTRADEYDIAVVDFSTHKVTVLTRGIYARHAGSGHLVYATSDGGLYALAFSERSLTTSGAVIPVLADVAREAGGALAHFAISRTGTLLYGRAQGGEVGDRLVWVDRSGRAQVVDTSASGALGSIALSPDGRRLAMTRSDNEGRNVWVKELDQGPMSRLSLGAMPSYGAGWTPDGRSVTWVAGSSGRVVLQRRADGSAPPETLLADAGNITHAAVSRDGQWIVYQSGAGAGNTGRNLYARRLRGDTTVLVLAESPAREEYPRLSPDGRWLAYLSNESGRGEVYVRPFPNTAASRTQVSVDGAYEPMWSPNGRELFYTSEAGILHAARVETSPSFRVVARDPLFDRTDYNFNPEGAMAYDMTPDGRRFIMVRAGVSSGMQLVMVLNWFADLVASR